MSIKDLVKLHIAVVALIDLGLRLDSFDDGFKMLQIIGRDHISLIEQDNVTELNLLDDETLEVVLAHVRFLQGIAKAELIAHAERIDNSHDGIKTRHSVLHDLLRDHLRISRDGLGDRCRLADTRGLNDDIVELLLIDDIVELLHEIHLQRAADATVLKSYERVIPLTDDTAVLDERRVDVHLADIIDDNGKLNAFLILQYAIQKRGLAAA